VSADAADADVAGNRLVGAHALRSCCHVAMEIPRYVTCDVVSDAKRICQLSCQVGLAVIRVCVCLSAYMCVGCGWVALYTDR